MDLSQLPLDVQLNILDKYREMILDIQENKLILMGDLKHRFENHWDFIEDRMWDDEDYIDSFRVFSEPEDPDDDLAWDEYLNTLKSIPEVENYFYENYLFPMKQFKISIICK